MSASLLASWTLFQREVVRFYRERSRVIGALVPPIVFWFLIGSGLGTSFRAPDAPAGTSFLQFFFPGTVILIVLFTSIFSMISVIEDRREGFLQGVLVAPVSRLSIVLGKVLGGAVLSTLQALCFVVLAPTVGLPLLPARLPFLLVELMLVSIGLAGLGFALAWRLDSTQGFHAVMNLFLIPLWLLSGALFPASSAPRWLRAVMTVNPVTYGVAALQHALALDAGRLPSRTLCLAATLAFAAAMLAWSAREAGRGA